MNPTIKQPTWQLIGQSVRGSSHVRTDKPNQDAIAWSPCTDDTSAEWLDATSDVVEGLPIIVAIADGHGSDRYVHSDRGSRFAVEITVSLLSEFIANYQEASLREMRRAAQEVLPTQILRRWKERVENDITENTSAESVQSEESTESAVEEGNSALRQNTNAVSLIAYGATLLACAVTSTYILYLQLGDGDILAVSADGSVDRPIGKDDLLIANETYSLCQPDAKNYFRFAFWPDALSSSELPTLIMLSTDGYANSFETESDFCSAAKDYWEMAQERGLDVVRERLKGWLDETSAHGSGDDITLAIVKRFSEDDPAIKEKRFAAVEETVVVHKKELPEIKDSVARPEQNFQVLSQRHRPLQWAVGILALLLVIGVFGINKGYREVRATIKNCIAAVDAHLAKSKPAASSEGYGSGSSEKHPMPTLTDSSVLPVVLPDANHVESEWPKPTSTPTVVQDELVALVRQYYAALDRRDDKSAVALWKNPPKGLTTLAKNVDYFKVNEASFRSAESDHASVWVDVIGKSVGAVEPEHWQGLVKLQSNAGKWGIVAMSPAPSEDGNRNQQNVNLKGIEAKNDTYKSAHKAKPPDASKPKSNHAKASPTKQPLAKAIKPKKITKPKPPKSTAIPPKKL